MLHRGRAPGLLGPARGLAAREHYRKADFIREFEKVVTGVTPEPQPSFLEKARVR